MIWNDEQEYGETGYGVIDDEELSPQEYTKEMFIFLMPMEETKLIRQRKMVVTLMQTISLSLASLRRHEETRQVKTWRFLKRISICMQAQLLSTALPTSMERHQFTKIQVSNSMVSRMER